MERKLCNSCGGQLNREGLYFVCPFCGNRWLADVADDVNAVARANAWEALRKSDFEKATELFEEIILKDKKDYESFWGLALAKASIVYVTDLEKDQKVPTLNNITEDSFIADKAVKTAINLAPSEIAESYKSQAEYIEKVRKEWLEKASKEPPYDVFICFKDSDREHGIERTQDSYDVQDLYTSLVSKGYKVFFSRETLRSKIAEQYEPYIYNAIKTAKIMIVFGEKAEYFSSPWLKNEWMRFKKRVESGEKHKNSLVTLYKGVNPYDIPTALTGGRQAIDYAIPSNFELLMNHVKTIVSESKQAKKLDKIEIKGGQMGKKSSEIKTETLQTREIGSSAVETSITDKQTLNLALAYVSAGEFKEAEKMLGELMIASPNNAELKWHYLKIKYRTDEKGLMAKLPNFADGDVALLKDIISTADKALATQVLNFLYDSQTALKEEKFLAFLNFILPFNYENRTEKLTKAFEISYEKRHFEVFKLLLTTLSNDQVDEYVERIVHYAKNSTDSKVTTWATDKILAVDEGNLWALETLYKNNLAVGDLPSAVEIYEKLLRYCQSVDEQVEKTLTEIGKTLKTQTDCDFAKQVLRYFSKDLATISDLLSTIAFKAVEFGHFEFAIDFCEIIIDKNPNLAEPYWALCLATLTAKTEKGVLDSDLSLNDLPEFKKYLTLVDSQRQIACIKLAKEQDGAIKKRAQAKTAEEQRLKIEREQRERLAKQQAEAEAKRKKAGRIGLTITAIACVVIALAITFFTTVFPVIKKDNFINTYGQSVYDKFGLVEKGATLKFGAYEQDNDTANGKEQIEWLVLDVVDGKALVISKYVLDCIPFNSEYRDVTWETCTLRSWLNNQFINTAFTNTEKTMIPTVTVTADQHPKYKNPQFDRDPGNDTQDKVFLLSIIESTRYFNSDTARQCAPTAYAIAQGCVIHNSGYCSWWLRTHGYAHNDAALISNGGYVLENGFDVHLFDGVRPALWLDLTVNVDGLLQVDYDKAVGLMKNGEYEEAIAIFEEIINYKDCQLKIKECKYNQALALMQNGKYEEAIAIFEEIADYNDCQAKIEECKYNQALALMQNGKYEEAIAIFETLGNYKDSQAKITECNALWGDKYNNALSLMDNGEYEEAIAIFEEIINYKDCQLKIKECKYAFAISLQADGLYKNAYDLFIELGDYKDSAQKASELLTICPFMLVKTGDYINFGRYEQDNNLENGKETIKWRILDVVGGKALIVSDRSLDFKQFNTTLEDVSWETSSIRTWLNSDFLNTAFTNEQQSFIPSATVTADKNPEYNVNPGNDTLDKIFLLSYKEVSKYFAPDDILCYTTAFANKDDPSAGDTGETIWALRTMGKDKQHVMNIYMNEIYYYGMPCDSHAKIRPALWLDLDANGDWIIQDRYDDAVHLLYAEKYKEAYQEFINLGNYKDSAQKANQILEKFPFLGAEIGDYITFGRYEQDNDTTNGKEQIEWLVLDVVDDKALVISKYVLDAKIFNSFGTTWENCSLRAWLNNEFINTAFTSAEQLLIPTTTVTADKNPSFLEVDAGYDVQDKLFLLSVNQAEQYFASDDTRKAHPTKYAISQGSYHYSPNGCWWWLRTPGSDTSRVSRITEKGAVDRVGYSGVVADLYGVRPALWIDLTVNVDDDFSDNY